MQALQWGAKELKTREGAYNDSPMLDAEILLSFVMQLSKARLIANMDIPVGEEKMVAYQNLVARRMKHEPIAYLIGKKPFYSRDFSVDRSTLIPRPATETLIECAINLLFESKKETSLFLDIGTGSGAIAITLAAETGIPVIASDLSPQALKIAKQNVEKHQMEELVDLRQGDLLEPVFPILKQLVDYKKEKPITTTIDHIILCANLPYLSDYQWERVQVDVKDFEPRTALTSGVDGLDHYWGLLQQIKKNRSLFPKQLDVLLEIDPSQTTRIQEMITHSFPLSEPRVIKDLQKNNRIVHIQL